MREPLGGPLTNFSIGTTIALLLLFGAGAGGGLHSAQTAALSSPPCGFAGGTLADPAMTQRCLAERFKAPKSRPPTAPPPSNAPSSKAPSSNAASSGGATSNRALPANQGS